MLRGLWIAPVPALGAALFSTRNSPVVLSGEPYHVTLMLDASGSMLLTAASLLWIAAGFYVPAFFRGSAMTGSFTVCWLFTLIGSLGIFLAADLVSFFLCYALVSLPAYGLVTYDGTPVARRAGAIYMGFALLGENLLLMGFVLLAANTPDGSLRIADAVDALQAAPSRTAILSLLIVGFGMKIALLPMHFWMPLSYTASPIPAAAVLSGAAVKAGVIGLIRFLPFDMTLPGWGELLTIVGFFGAFYGVAVGITQSNPKTVLAYSSVSQMGFLAAVLGMGLSTGDASVAPLAAFYAAHHVLVKGALFLSVGAAALTGAHRMGLVLAPGTVIALGLAGLPLTGGALAKLAVKDPLGYGIAGTLAMLSAAGTALLMTHFLFRLAATADHAPKKPAPVGLFAPWLATAVLCLIVPWASLPSLRPWTAFRNARSGGALEDLLARGEWRNRGTGLSAVESPPSPDSGGRHRCAGRMAFAPRDGLRSCLCKSRRRAEAVDDGLSCTSFDCRPSDSGHACRRLKTQPSPL